MTTLPYYNYHFTINHIAGKYSVTVSLNGREVHTTTTDIREDRVIKFAKRWADLQLIEANH